MSKRFERIRKNYPTIHLFGNWYLVRMYGRKAKRISLWSLKNKRWYPDD